LLDLMTGGVGMRRGRPDPETPLPGSTLDFWRVQIYEPGRRLRLLAQMRVPGRAWLEFRAEAKGRSTILRQIAWFEPHGLGGLLYWYLLWPIHEVMFRGMLRRIAAAALGASTPGAATAPPVVVRPKSDDGAARGAPAAARRAKPRGRPPPRSRRHARRVLPRRNGPQLPAEIWLERARGRGGPRRGRRSQPLGERRAAPRGRAKQQIRRHARLLASDATRAHATSRRGFSNCVRWTRRRGEADEAACSPRSWRTARRGPARERWRHAGAGTRDPVAPCAWRLDPDGTRAHATPAASGSTRASGREAHGEAGEAARSARRTAAGTQDATRRGSSIPTARAHAANGVNCARGRECGSWAPPT